MKNHNKITGKSGEDLAAKYLIGQGYKILHRNYVTTIGELDIVAAMDGLIVVVEVKTRLSLKYGEPAEAVGYHKIRKISQVAAQYIKKFRLYNHAVRFDVIEVYAEDKTVNHIIGAFDSPWSY